LQLIVYRILLANRLEEIALLARAVVAFSFLFACLSLQAQPYPGKPIRLVVPFPPGGGTDVVARTVAPKMAEVLGQTIIVDNRAGAGGNIGAAEVAKAAPDGYTMLLAASTVAVNATLMPNLPFDPLKDFAPVVLLLENQSLLLVHPSSPASNVREFIALAKQKRTTYASSGNGSGAHLAGELFKMMAGVDLVHVPYKGAAPAMNDLIGGHVDSIIIDMSVAMPQVQGGRVKALAIGSAKRFESLPEVPTIAEAGVPGYEIAGLMGFVVPANTPREAIEKLNRAANVALGTPGVRKRLTDLALIPLGGPPERMDDRLRADIEKYGRVVRAAKMKVE
jgi:tripartite-type tricarboxylate transporter receptor subunit TctC